MKKLLTFLVLLSTLLIPYMTNAGQISLSTFYPAPMGSYDRLRFVQQTGAITCDATVEGLIIYDTDDQLKLCDSTASWSVIGGSTNTWTQSGNNLFPADTATNPSLLVGIGTQDPEFKLTIDDNDGGILAKGTFGVGTALTTAGAGTRLIWYPLKAAFRVGDVSGAQWDDNNIGNASVALGSDTTASGTVSTAMGASTTASGISSTAMGSGTTASGDTSTAMGLSSTAQGISSFAAGDGSTAKADGSIAMGLFALAKGDGSVAIGNNVTAFGPSTLATGSNTSASESASTAMGFVTTANGRYSTAMGRYTTAQDYASTVLGSYNIIPTGSATAWFGTDTLFIIGNGTADAARSNVMTVLKNGNVGIGTTTPGSKLHIGGTAGVDGITFPDGTLQTTAATSSTPVMTSSGKQCGGEWYPPAGYYNFSGAHAAVYMELNTSAGWGGGDNSGANAGTMWVDGVNMRFQLNTYCVFWQKFDM